MICDGGYFSLDNLPGVEADPDAGAYAVFHIVSIPRPIFSLDSGELMWQFLNSNAAAVQAISAVVVVLLTLALTTATFRYVRLTKQIAKASITQAEAVHKPILTFKRDDRISTAIDLERHSCDCGTIWSLKRCTNLWEL